jgi:hypothetical protein
MLEDMYPALIQAPDQPLSGFRLLRTVIDNPIKAWPRAVYREDVYRSRRFGRDTVFVMAPALVRTVLLDDADNFENGCSVAPLLPFFTKRRFVISCLP